MMNSFSHDATRGRGVATHGYLAHVPLEVYYTKVVCRASPAPATQPATARGGVGRTMSDEPWEDDFAKPGAAAGGMARPQSPPARARSSPRVLCPHPVCQWWHGVLSRDTICKVLSTNWVQLSLWPLARRDEAPTVN